MLAQTTVLVVDDNPGIVYLLQEALSHAGYHVVTAVARDAQQLAAELQPAVILLDIMMPEMDGMQVRHSLRTDRRTAHIPVIAISARLNLHIHAAEMEADDYLAKPFELSELVHKIEAWARPSAGSAGGGI